MKGLSVNQHTWYVICANIDDNDTRFEPGALNKLGFSNGGDEDVGFFDLGVVSKAVR